MLLILGVDGTGESNDLVYEKRFANSHVKRLVDSDGSKFRIYERGPTTDDFDETQVARKISSLLRLADQSDESEQPRWRRVVREVRDKLDLTDPHRMFSSLIEHVRDSDGSKLPRAIASLLKRDDRDALLKKLDDWRSETQKLGRQVHDAAVAARESDDKLRLVLIGYSRGGAAVIHAAQLLKDKVQVDAMFLFDAVDRSLGVETERIPSNVQVVRHARRDPWSLSRLYFGNCGTDCDDSKTDYQEAFFRCTHGGLGGTPWPCPRDKIASDLILEARVPTRITFDGDAKTAQDVWNWMSQEVQRLGSLRVQD